MKVIINYPKKMNHLTLGILHLFLERLIEWRNNPKRSPRVMILEGAGGKSFCSGGDMRGLYDANYGVKPKKF